MEKAIKRAQEAGWHYNLSAQNCDQNSNDHTLLDPFFWQSLGKAERWEEPLKIWHITYKNSGSEITLTSRWQNEWHNFIDHLAEGKDINSFFEELLK